MVVHWLIEAGVFERTAKGVCNALAAVNQPWTRYYDGINDTDLPSTDQPVLFWGSLGAAYADRVAERWTPGAVGDAQRFACSAYFSALRDIPFANSDAVFTTVSELVADTGRVVGPLGSPDRLFVRPDSPLKPFSGRELSVTEVSLAALDHGFYYEDEQLPVVVSSPKEVGREWRFVIGERTVVAECEYQASRDGAGTDVPDGARALAERVAAAQWQAASLYVVDVGEADGEHRVMELNPFSGADLYDCDPKAVVEVASRIAARLFEEGSIA
jgi:hypothetical protein